MHIYDMSDASVYTKNATIITARRVTRGEEIIPTREGIQIAKRGDWVLTGEEGDVWLTNAATFLQNYEIADDPLPGAAYPPQGTFCSKSKRVLALPITEDMDILLGGQTHHGTRGDYLVVVITPEMEEVGGVARILSKEGQWVVDLDKVSRYFIDPDLFHKRYKAV